jgi:hypothetical protein
LSAPAVAHIQGARTQIVKSPLKEKKEGKNKMFIANKQ